MILLLQVSLLSHVLLPLHVMQHLFQVVVARVVIDAMVHMLLHVTTLVHMLLHSVGVLDACATAILWMWLLHVLLLVMVALLLLLCV